MSSPFERRWDDSAPAQRRRMRKGMYILPSLFTAANIGAGYFALAQTLQGAQADAYWHFDLAAKAIGVAVVADGLDGRIARMTNTTSDFGREFDSLADVITFGVAPAILAFVWGFRWLTFDIGVAGLPERLVQIGLIASFLFLVAGASRRARVNIQVNPQPSNPGRPGRKYFVGMPIPAGAGVVAATVHLAHGQPVIFWWLALIWTALLAVVSFLMVSTWRFYSFKDINLRSRHPFWVVILICGLFYLIWFFSDKVLFLIAMAYMLSGILTRMSSLFRRRPQAAPPAYEEAPEPR
jgi:CDP-diacylglycerol---serine O-phosphatidyltransferase